MLVSFGCVLLSGWVCDCCICMLLDLMMLFLGWGLAGVGGGLFLLFGLG